jgi:hypothetical protein
MAQFFFHLRGNLHGLSRDELGLEFPDVETAYLEAFRAARDMQQELVARGQDPRGYGFEVVNASDELVFDLPFSEVLDHQAGRRPAKLSRMVQTAMERGNRMMRLSAEVAQQVQLVQENLRRSQDLLRSLGRRRMI